MRIEEAYNVWSATYDLDRNLTRDLDEIVTRETLASWLKFSKREEKLDGRSSGACHREDSCRMRRKKVAVNDLMQKGHIYFLTEPLGRSFHPDFHPP